MVERFPQTPRILSLFNGSRYENLKEGRIKQATAQLEAKLPRSPPHSMGGCTAVAKPPSQGWEFARYGTSFPFSWRSDASVLEITQPMSDYKTPPNPSSVFTAMLGKAKVLSPEASSCQTEAAKQSEVYSCNYHFRNIPEPRVLCFLEVLQGKPTKEEWCHLVKVV